MVDKAKQSDCKVHDACYPLCRMCSNSEDTALHELERALQPNVWPFAGDGEMAGKPRQNLVVGLDFLAPKRASRVIPLSLL